MYKILIISLLLMKVGLVFSQTKQQISEFEAEKYLGKYKLETPQISAEGEVSFENGDMYFYTEGIPRVKLLADFEKDTFKADKFEIYIRFIENEFKQIEAAEIQFQGQKFLAQKQ
jgi:hypothetical protein